MWKGRFSQQTDDKVRNYSESISFDWRLYAYDVEGSIAHAAGLVAGGIITQEEFSQIEAGLREIQAEIERGEFAFDYGLEDIHMNIEAELTSRIGDAGAKLHTARSRNDQVALDLRLYCRAETAAIQNLIRKLQRSLVALAWKNSDVVIPGYTHLQRAQPVLFAHHLLAYVEMLERDHGRLEDAKKRIEVMPLGSGAIAGSTISLDRAVPQERLGFAGISRNSMDAVSDRDFACELLFGIAMIGMHLSRLSEDVILWCSSEFKFITLSDAYTTGSSLMPQKKNPDVAELTRGKSGRLYGNLFTLLTVLKGLPMTYNRDMQEDKEPLFDSVLTVKAALDVFAGMMRAAEVDKERTAEAAGDVILLATDLADYLVNRQIPFPRAHEIVGKLVALSLTRGLGLDKLSLEEYRGVDPVFGEDVFEVFNLQRSLESRKATGAPSPAGVAEQIKEWRRKLGEH